MPPLVLNFRYRPEVDGLRAIAVLAVVYYHAGLGLPGGFIGVDVFFVISGFLITSLILSDCQEDKFTLAHFWERRARRIIPALTAVILGTIIIGWFLLLPREYAALGKSAACQSVFGANFFFYRTTLGGYFAGAANEMPLLHTWSLAVEEQFYLIVPLTFAALFRFPRLRNRRVLLVLFGAGILLSFLASLYGVAHYRIASFYLLPTRAWELLVGSSLAIFPLTWMTKHRLPREVASYVGLAGILIPCLLYTGKTPFPGLAALPPCLGTALIIWSSSPLCQNTLSTSLSRILAARPAVFVGLISYSLYLWHWPIFAFSNYYWTDESLTLGYRLALVALAFALAILTWRFIETPFRQKALCASKRSIFRFAAAALLVSFAPSAAIFIFHGLPQRLPETLRAVLSTNPQDDFLFVNEMQATDVAAGHLVPFGSPAPDQPVKVLVWGDSHAMSALPAFDALLKAKNMSGRAATHSSTAPVLGYFYETRYGLGKDALRFNEEVVSFIARKKIPHVVLVASWYGYPSHVADGVSQHSTTSIQSALVATVEKLVAIGSQPWIVLQVPSHHFDVSNLIRQRRLTIPDFNQDRFCAKPDARNGIAGDDPSLLDELTKAGAKIIDPRPAFLNPSNGRYQISLDGVILYRDSHHLTKRGAEKILTPVLERSFLPYLTAQASGQ